jgi:nucleotide-binding universal stress UspA family protein
MTVEHDTPERPAVRPESVFAHALVGVDGTEAGLEACRQAAALVEPEGSLDLVLAVETVLAVYTGLSAQRVAAELEREGADALAAASEIVGGRASARLIDGAPTATLLRELARTGASLLVVGSHGHRRLAEMLLGGVSGELLHRAPCSVLLARKPVGETLFPRSLLVGVDGSAEANRALGVAHHLAERFAAPLRIVTALRDGDENHPRVHLSSPFAEEIDERPVDALEKASTGVDLLIVGSRGLHGARALGSVSERIAHHAACSVLVVRGPELA